MAKHLPNINDFHTLFFLGIGGIGMSALARYFAEKSFHVTGYDSTPTKLTTELQKLGCEIVFSNNPDDLPNAAKNADKTLVIRTAAIRTGDALFDFFSAQNYPQIKRSELLGILTKRYKGLAVAGTHGKTTTSTLLAHILYGSSLTCNAFLGGISSNYNTNYIANDDAEYTVIEADEFDRSFLQLSPFASIITSTDADHLDIYGESHQLLNAFQEFVDLTPTKGIVVRQLGTQVESKATSVSYHFSDPTADYHTTKVVADNGQFVLDVQGPRWHWEGVAIGLPGPHNAENALACIALCDWLGVSEAEIRHGLKTFKGVKRRFERHIDRPDLIYIDDYAHHPTEINALLDAVEMLYPHHRKVGWFQPHLFSRTQDFMEGFAQSLSRLDECRLMPIYPARELPIQGVTSDVLLEKIKSKDKKIVQHNNALDALEIKEPTLFLTIGAGNIDLLVDQILEKWGG